LIRAGRKTGETQQSDSESGCWRHRIARKGKERHVELAIALTSDAMSALDAMSTELRREAWERINLLAGNPVHPHPSLRAHRLRRLGTADDKWDAYITTKHRIIYDFTDGVVRIWTLGDHAVVDRVRNLSFAAGTLFRRTQEEQAPVEEPALFVPPEEWSTLQEMPEQPFACLSPAHLRVLGVPATCIKTVQECSDFGALEGIGLPTQTCAWLEELATDEESAAELFCPDDLFFRTTLSRLEGYCEGRIKRLMLNLEPEQQQYVDREVAGPMLLKGCAGSGKTTVAVYRALRLAEEGKRVVFLTYSSALAEVARSLLVELAGDPLSPELEVHTVTQWASKFIAGRGRRWTIVSEEQQKEAMQKAVGAARVVVQHPVLEDTAFLLEEVRTVIKAGGLSEDEYLRARRYGRGKALQEGARRAVWTVYEMYQTELTARHLADWEDIPLMALAELEKVPLGQSFDQVVVDEAQDLTGAEIRLASRLGAAVFLVGDVAQSIYTRGYTWRDAGLALQGRSFSLRRNFRNTRQVAEAAAGLIRHNVELVASEDWVDPELTRRVGPKPFVLQVEHRDQEIAAICERILDLAGGNEFRIGDFAVLCRFNDQCERVQQYLTGHHVPALIRDRNSPFDILEQKVKVLTIHSAKGLEFPVVFVLGWHEGQLPYLVHGADAERVAREVEEERMLAYVAMTRAAEVLYLVSSPEQPSRFLDEIPEALLVPWGHT
jgi:superfamily I DNA/RNA helicase